MEFPVSHPVQKNLQAPSHSLQFNSLSQYTNCAKNFHQNGVYGFVSYSGPHIINIGNLNPNSGTSIGQKLSQPKSRRDTTSHPWRWPLTNKEMSVGEDVENLVPVHCWLECGTVRPLNSMAVFQTVKHRITMRSSNFTSRHTTKKRTEGRDLKRYLYIRCSQAALVTWPKSGKYPWPSTGEWVNTLWHTRPMEY